MPRPSSQPASRPGIPLLLTLLALPILAAYAIMARFFLNVPLIDDYPTILGFAVRYQALPTPAARLHYIFADQYTEYKLLFIHLFTAAQLALTGHVSFTVPIWLGQLSLLGILAVLWKSHFRAIAGTRQRILLFTPILLLLFTLNYGEALDWLAPCIGYLFTILLSLTALYLLAEGASPNHPWRTTMLAALAAFTACSIAANAFFLGPLGLYPLLTSSVPHPSPPHRDEWEHSTSVAHASRLHGDKREYSPQRPRRLILWSMAFLLALFPYAVHYHRELHTGTGSPWLIPIFFVDFLGAAAPFTPFVFPLGLAVLAVFALALRTGFLRTHPAATLGVTWLFISAALAAIGRGRTGLTFATASRYKIYSDLFLIFCYGYLAQRFLTRESPVAPRTRHRTLTAAITLATLLCLRGDYQGYHILRNRQHLLQAAYARYHQDPARNSPIWFNDPPVDQSTPIRIFAAQALQDLNAARAAHLYTPPGAR